MTRYVAFLRAVNVAGHAKIKMAELRDVFAAAGARHVTTYIQSGNVVFEAGASETSVVLERVRQALGRTLGEQPEIMLRKAAEISRLLTDSVFASRRTRADVKHYVVFLSRRPRRQANFPLTSVSEALDALELRGREVFVVSRRKKNGFYGFPNNFVEKELGVPATSRNWSTVTKLAALIEAQSRA